MFLENIVDISNPYVTPELNSVYDKLFIEFFSFPKIQSLINTNYFSEDQINLLLFYWHDYLHKYEDLRFRFSASPGFVLGVFLLNCGIEFRYLGKDFLNAVFKTDFNQYRIKNV